MIYQSKNLWDTHLGINGLNNQTYQDQSRSRENEKAKVESVEIWGENRKDVHNSADEWDGPADQSPAVDLAWKFHSSELVYSLDDAMVPKT